MLQSKSLQWEGIEMTQMMKSQLFGNVACATMVEANRLKLQFLDTKYTMIRMISKIITIELVIFASLSLRLS